MSELILRGGGPSLSYIKLHALTLLLLFRMYVVLKVVCSCRVTSIVQNATLNRGSRLALQQGAAESAWELAMIDCVGNVTQPRQRPFTTGRSLD
jgi:hypothetical protein